jgi:hypothetical protein
VLPAWAIIPTATKLVVQSFRHPKEEQVILIDEDHHRVSIVPVGEAESRGNGVNRAAFEL